MRRRSGRNARGSSVVVGRAVLVLALVIASSAGAQVCGDADGSGTTSLTDGVQVLREAAGLGSKCSARACDVDDNGVITVSDGVAILRRAAQLSSEVSCGTRFGKLVKTIVVGGTTADLKIGDPPTPDPGARQDIVAFDGPSKIQRGQAASFVVQLSRPVDALVIAFQENDSVVDGFVEVFVPGNPGPIALEITAGDQPGSAELELRVASRVGGQLGAFQTRPLSITATNAQGLILHYPFDGDATDQSGNGNDGVVNGATLAADRFGRSARAYGFVGTLGTTISTSFVPPNIFSLSLWYYAAPTQLQNAGIVSTYSTGSYNGFYYPHGGVWEAFYTDHNVIHSIFPVTADQWIHVAVVSDGSLVQVFKNSEVVLSLSATTTHADTLIIGTSRFNEKFFTGTIDDVRIYDRPLSTPEVQQLFNESQ